MKHTKLLKSAVLSTALLWSGAVAQTTGDMSLEIVDPTSLTVAAGALNFGTYNAGASQGTATLTCASGGDTTAVSGTGFVEVTGGTCGTITVDTAATTNVNFNISVSSAALALPSGGTDLAAPTLVIYDDAFATVGASDQETLTGGAAETYKIGGVVLVPDGHGAGTYSGSYTVTATIV